MTDIRGKNVLLTGGSRGLGPVIAEALARQGVHLALAARSAQDLQLVASKLKELGTKVITIPVDLTRSADRRRLVAFALEQFDQIDILVNNAGLETEGAFLDLSWESVEQTLQVNLAAPLELTHLLLPHMLARQSGHIVNIASIGAKNGIAYDAVYCGTKAGLAEWTTRPAAGTRGQRRPLFDPLPWLCHRSRHVRPLRSAGAPPDRLVHRRAGGSRSRQSDWERPARSDRQFYTPAPAVHPQRSLGRAGRLAVAHFGRSGVPAPESQPA